MTRPDKRNKIVCAALELITAYGFHGAPMSMIAKRANVGAGTIYRYFENKDMLIQSLFNDIEKRMIMHLREGYSAEMPIRERFMHLGTKLLWYFITYPVDFRYLEQFHNSPYGVAHRRDAMLGKSKDDQVFTELFKQGVARQIIKNISIVLLFDLAVGPLISAARDHILGFFELNESLIHQIVEACWDALKR